MKKEKNKIFLEIGFGYGENLINLAKKNKNNLILGCEIYKPAIAHLVKKIEENNLKNIAIFSNDIFLLFKKIKNHSVKKIFLLFPDPWKKKKHHKRRLVSQALIKNFDNILEYNGEIYVSTDSKDYLKVILEIFLKSKNFLWVDKKPRKCFKRPEILARTKYEKKADLNSNKKYFLKFKKKS